MLDNVSDYAAPLKSLISLGKLLAAVSRKASLF